MTLDGIISYFYTKYYTLYYYFDDQDNFSVKELNIFENIARKYFGFFKETHLLNVVNKFCLLSSKGDLNLTMNLTTSRKKILLTLIAKANWIYMGIVKNYKLYDLNLADNTEATVYMNYKTDPYSPNFPNSPSLQIAHINSVDVSIDLKDDVLVDVHFKKIDQDKVLIYTSYFTDFETDTVPSINYHLRSRREVLISKIAKKILHDSSSIKEVRYVRNYYGSRPDMSGNILNHDNSRLLNEAQKQNLSKLGWTHESDFDRKSDSSPSTVYKMRLYKMTKTDNDDSPNDLTAHKLSLEFAFKHMIAEPFA